MNILDKIDKYLEEKVRVDTSDHFNAHQKQPSGHGTWAFGFNGKKDTKELFLKHNMKYGEALKHAKAEAKKRKATSIHVMG